MIRADRERRRAGAAAALAAVVLALATASALAVPPGGAEDVPGKPAGVVTVTDPDGLIDGEVRFCVQGFRVDTASGPVAQRFMVKFDDFGNYGIGPFAPSADGSFCGAVSTDPAAHRNARGGAADKLPADLCDASKQHWLRFLSGPWGAPGSKPEASLRSLSASFAPAGACGAGTWKGAGSGGGGGSGGDGSGGGGGGGTATFAAPRLGGKLLRAGPRRIAVRLRAGEAARGTVTVRTAHEVRLGERRRRVVLARGSFNLGAERQRTVRPALTAAGRVVLAQRARLGARVIVVARPPAGGRAATRSAGATVLVPAAG